MEIDPERIKVLAEKPDYAAQIVKILKKLKGSRPQDALALLKALFLAPATHPEVRYAIAAFSGEFKHPQFYNQLLSYFILKTFPDKRALIRALRSYAHPDAVPALIQCFLQDATLEERIEIIEALAAVPLPETVEFLSQIYNNQVEYPALLPNQELQIVRERASSALSKQILRFT